MDLNGTMQLSQSLESDVFSDPIYFRDGIPVGTSVVTAAHVSILFSGISAISTCMYDSSYFPFHFAGWRQWISIIQTGIPLQPTTTFSIHA